MEEIMKKKLFSLTLATALCLANGLVGMEAPGGAQHSIIDRLPKEIRRLIFSKLHLTEFLRISQANKKLYFLFKEDKKLFEHILLHNVNELANGNKTPLDLALEWGDNQLAEILKLNDGKETYDTHRCRFYNFAQVFDHLEKNKTEIGDKLICIGLCNGGIESRKNEEYPGYFPTPSRRPTGDEDFSDGVALRLAEYNVVSLDLSLNRGVRLPDKFVELKDLQVLNLAHACRLAMDDLKIIAKHPSLRLLDLSDTAFYGLIHPNRFEENLGLAMLYWEAVRFVINEFESREDFTVLHPHKGMAIEECEEKINKYRRRFVGTLRQNRNDIEQYLTDNWGRYILRCSEVSTLLEKALSSRNHEESSLAIKQLVTSLQRVDLNI